MTNEIAVLSCTQTKSYVVSLELQFVKQTRNLIFHRKGEPSAPHPPAVLQAWQASLLPILRFAVVSTASPCIGNIYGTDYSCKTGLA